MLDTILIMVIVLYGASLVCAHYRIDCLASEVRYLREKVERLSKKS